MMDPQPGIGWGEPQKRGFKSIKTTYFEHECISI